MELSTMGLIVLLLVISAFRPATEIAYSSMSCARLKSMDLDGKDRRIQRVLVVSEDLDRFLTNILVGNNIVNIVSSTITTSILADLFSVLVGPIWATVLMVTILLVISEITLKSFVKKNAEHFAIGC